MSFSVSCSGCGLEYSGRRPFAQPRNAASPASSRCSGRSGAGCARRGVARGRLRRSRSREYLDEHGYSQRFRRHFLVPLTSALWSTAPGRALEFPAAYAIRFFDNHGMLGFGRFRWRTVTGGSRRYVDAIARAARRAAPARERRPLDPAHAPTASSCASATARSSASTASSSRRTPTRRSRCSRTRRADERRVLGAFALHDERGGPAHRLVASCRERGARAPPGTTASATTAARRSPTT